MRKNSCWSWMSRLRQLRSGCALALETSRWAPRVVRTESHPRIRIPVLKLLSIYRLFDC
jgi:hypothetical protein